MISKQFVAGGDGNDLGVRLKKTSQKDVARGFTGFYCRIDGTLHGSSSSFCIQVGRSINECPNRRVRLGAQFGHELHIFRRKARQRHREIECPLQ